jgi:hypothetical protein
MRRFTFALLASLTVASVACVRVKTDPVTGKTDVDVESPTKKGEVWTGKLTGEGTGAAISGTVRTEVLKDQTTATISLTGGPAGASLPWHVHEGKCSTGGPIVGDPAAYTPLSVGDDGHAERSAKLAVSLNEARDYHVNVHASAADMSTIIACAGLHNE